MATPSNILAWEISWTEDTSELQFLSWFCKGPRGPGLDGWAQAGLYLPRAGGRGPAVFPPGAFSSDHFCSNYCTIALISHTSKVMLKTLQASIEPRFPTVQADSLPSAPPGKPNYCCC